MLVTRTAAAPQPAPVAPNHVDVIATLHAATGDIESGVGLGFQYEDGAAQIRRGLDGIDQATTAIEQLAAQGRTKVDPDHLDQTAFEAEDIVAAQYPIYEGWTDSAILDTSRLAEGVAEELQAELDAATAASS